MALKMNEIRAAEAALFFLERFTIVEIILHDKTPLLAIDLLLLATTTILYAVLYSARQHLGRPYSDESNNDKLRYICSERLGLLFVLLWMFGRCFYGLILGRAILIYTSLKYLFDYLEYIITEDRDDDSDDDDETQRKVEDSQVEQKGSEDYQVVEDNVSSNDEETQKREHSAEFPQVVITSFEDWLCLDVNGTQDDKNNDDEDEKENVDGDGDEEEENDYDIDYVDEGEEGEEDYSDSDSQNGNDDSDSENGSNDGDGGESDDNGGGGSEGGGGEEEDKDKKEEEDAGVDTENATEENKFQEELQELRVDCDNLKNEKDIKL